MNKRSTNSSRLLPVNVLAPLFLRLNAFVASRPALQKIASNTSWLLFDKLFRMGAALLINVWVARYLGPAQFGVYSYALAFTALFASFTTLGLDGIVVRDMVKKPEKVGEILGTTLLLRLVGGLVSYSLILAALWVVPPPDPRTFILVAIISLGLVFQSVDSVDLWFQSRTLSKFTIYARLPGFVFSAALKIGLVLLKAPLVAFAVITLAEVVLAAIGLLIVYRTSGEPIHLWRFSRREAKALLGQSWPLILSGVAAAVYMKIDQIMLGQLAGAREVGVYAAAARLSEAWYFIPTAIVASVFPSLIRAKQTDDGLYQRRLQQLFDTMVWLALTVAVPVTLASKLIIDTLYGSSFEAAAVVLSIHVWAGLFIFMRAVLSKWLIAENLLWLSLVSHGVGAIVNVLLNLVLIPRLAGVGAALATVVSYAAASYLFCVMHKETRVIGRMMSLALLSPPRLLLRSLGSVMVRMEGRR